jgi:hypothetical protein
MVFLTRVFGLDGSKNFGVGLFDQYVAVVHGSPSNDGALAIKIDKGCPGERLKATQETLKERLEGCALPSGSLTIESRQGPRQAGLAHWPRHSPIASRATY